MNDERMSIDLPRPSNLLATGIVADREAVADVDGLISKTLNEEAVALFSRWRRQEQFRFVVMAGAMNRRHGRVAGGMAATWEQALDLCRALHGRFTELSHNARGICATDLEHQHDRELTYLWWQMREGRT